MKVDLHPILAKTIKQLSPDTITDERKAVCQPLIDYINEKTKRSEEINLNFICTHNSRRSQLSQLWAQTAAYYYCVKVNCYSGGIEVTAFNKHAVASTKRMGFEVFTHGEGNPLYTVSFANKAQPLVMFSKLFDDSSSPTNNFTAIMTCSHADDNCPIILGAEVRIPLLYKDPKAFDGTSKEANMYDKRSLQIATEMLYIFSKINN